MPFRAQIEIPMFTNFPSDVITNTLCFESLSLVTADMATEWNPRIVQFYQTIYSSTWPMANYTSAVANWRVNWYDLSEPKPRQPLVTAPFTGVTIEKALTVVPTEVSAVLSFEGTRVSGIPQARRRGRIYLGALSTAIMETSSAGAFPRLQAGFLTAISNAAETLMETGDNESWWAVWSETDQTSVRINNGWVDNSPDTQRRRSVNATARTLWPVTP